MATHEIPDLEHRPLVEYINTRKLRSSAQKVVSLLSKIPELKVWKVQYKAPEYADNAWYIGLAVKDDPILINIKMTPANYNVEFRFPHYLPQDVINVLKWQNRSWLYAGHNQHGETAIIKMIKSYLISIKEDYAAGIVKSGGKSSAEKMIRKLLESLYPNTAIQSNVRPDDLRSTKNRPLELDIYIPNINLAIEIQGPQHFGNGLYGLNADLMENDLFKKEWCRHRKIKLIWMNWDGITRDLFRKSEAEQRQHLSDLLEKLFSDGHYFLAWGNIASQQWE